jgi:hypothetical protein
MKKQHAHNHPAVRAWTPELQREKELREKQEWRTIKRALIQKVEFLIAGTFLIASLPTVAWMSENDAPVVLTAMAMFGMIGFALAIMMEDRKA